MFGSIVAGKGGDNLLDRGVAAAVAMSGEPRRVALSLQNAANDLEPGGTGDVAQHQVQHQVHLGQRLLHALDVAGGFFHQARALAQIGAQHHDFGGRAEAGTEQPNAVELTQPLAVSYITFASAHVAQMVGVDQHHLDPACFEDLEDWNPVNAGGFHCHRLDPAFDEPVGQLIEIRGERAECVHRLRIPIRRHCHVVMLGPAIDTGSVGLNALQQWGPAGMSILVALCPRCFSWLLALHLRLFHSRIRRPAFADRGRRETDILSNGITTGDVTNDAIAAPHGPCS